MPPHPIFPLSTVHVGTLIPNPSKGSVFTVSKTLTVQAGFPW